MVKNFDTHSWKNLCTRPNLHETKAVSTKIVNLFTCIKIQLYKRKNCSKIFGNVLLQYKFN